MVEFWKLIFTIYLHERCCYIGFNTSFADETNFPHFFGIFISNDAKIGSNCTIYQNVTIGSNRIATSKYPGAPLVGDNVVIGASATIIGGVSIGNNCRIGANCTVAINIPDNCIVVAERPRILKMNHDSVDAT